LKKDTEFNQLVDDKLIFWARKDFSYSLYFAEAYAMIDNKPEALNWLENSINHGLLFTPSSINLILFLKTSVVKSVSKS
jgi:hypothetical protein